MKQVYNPFLPLDEYVPDGEAHVFEGRVYIFGSHDMEGGYTFCMRDYVTYSADINNLTDWKYEGVIYKASQDPKYGKIFEHGTIRECDGSKSDDSKALKYMFAPDVVRGNDGKYYLYYGMGGEYGYGGYAAPISVAVSDSPNGPYEFAGHVKNKDGSLMLKYVCFDPAVINDDGIIRLYYGTQYDYEEVNDIKTNAEVLNKEMEMFGRTKEDILSYKESQDSIMGPVMLTLEDDMVTVKEEAGHIIPYEVKGTSFEAHPFFEGSSIRKIGSTYYFVYSSWLNHELCYATSKYPDKDFVYGGTIISNGDVGLNGRSGEDRLNMTGTTHGCIESINGEVYVFFHRLTHKSDYSRQACAEKIKIKEDGSISQVEFTSCGLNGKPLNGIGIYPSVIACNLTQGQMPHGSNTIYGFEFPHVTHSGTDRIIAEIENETLMGYKYFDFNSCNPKEIKVKVRFEDDSNKVIYDVPLRQDERCYMEEKRVREFQASREPFGGSNPCMEVKTDLAGDIVARIELDSKCGGLEWHEFSAHIELPLKEAPLYFIYRGNEKMQFLEFELV